MSESSKQDDQRDPDASTDPDDGSVVHIPGPLPEEIVITFAYSGERIVFPVNYPPKTDGA